MALKNIAVAWFGGGALLLGYAGLAWLRAQRGRQLRPVQDVEPLSQRLERVPEELALESDFELPANSNASARHSSLGASFFARATDAFSPFATGPGTPVPR